MITPSSKYESVCLVQVFQGVSNLGRSVWYNFLGVDKNNNETHVLHAQFYIIWGLDVDLRLCFTVFHNIPFCVLLSFQSPLRHVVSCIVCEFWIPSVEMSAIHESWLCYLYLHCLHCVIPHLFLVHARVMRKLSALLHLLSSDLPFVLTCAMCQNHFQRGSMVWGVCPAIWHLCFLALADPVKKKTPS